MMTLISTRTKDQNRDDDVDMNQDKGAYDAAREVETERS